jgi:hypothetical protein
MLEGFCFAALFASFRVVALCMGELNGVLLFAVFAIFMLFLVLLCVCFLLTCVFPCVFVRYFCRFLASVFVCFTYLRYVP